MLEQNLVLWSSRLPQSGDLANCILRFHGREELSLTFIHLNSHRTYTLSFEQVVGFRFQNAFGVHRLCNVFKVQDSAWIAAMQRQSWSSKPLDPAQHYIISSAEGEIEIVALDEPTIEVKSGKLNDKTMNCQEEIISELATRECRGISQKIIQSLSKMTDEMQSGDDSPLKNVWEEICVQVQGEASLMWDWYIDTIESLIQVHVTNLDGIMQRAIWLQTEEGTDWCFGDKQQSDDCVPVSSEDITKHILEQFVLSAASSETNRRIEMYLEREVD